jgi:hypothetical protein
MIPQSGGFGMTKDEGIAFLEKQVEYGRNLGGAIADVALILMSRYSSNPYPAANTLRSALTDWLCAGTIEQIRVMKAAPAFMSGPFVPPPSVERLASLVKRREQLQSTLDEYEEMIDKISGMPAGELMGEYTRTTLALPIQRQIEDVEREISEMQRSLESAEPEDDPPEAQPDQAGGR